MTSAPNLDQLTPDQLRTLAAQLLTQVDVMGKRIYRDQTVIENLNHEIAILKRRKFAKRSEQLSPDQGRLLDDLLDTDIVAIEAELKAVNPPASAPAAASCYAWVKTSAKNWITRRACSPSSSTCVGNGPAASAKR